MSEAKEKKLSTKGYNTTDLQPFDAINKNILHRDISAHISRWSLVLKHADMGESICDFGCGSANLLELFYRNKFTPKKYIGFEIRLSEVEKNRAKFGKLAWAEFVVQDLIKSTYDFKTVQADKVISFEVLEHVGKQNVDIFLQNFRDCGSKDALYYLSTPCFDEKGPGAAGNHTYDSGDGRGVAPQEFEHFELQGHLEKYFTIQHKYGTFASIKDYKHLLNDWQKKMFDTLSSFYDTNVLSNLMAPMFPEQSRNCLWILKRK